MPFDISYNEWFGYTDITIYDTPFHEHVSFNPFIWRNSLYMVTFDFTVYRIAKNGKLT